MSRAGVLSGVAKSKEVGRLLQVLGDGDDCTDKGKVDVLDVLTQLKIHGRDPKNAEPMYCKDGISVLANYAFAEPTPTSREALRCIANALLLGPALRQDFIDLGLTPKATNRMSSEDYDDEFLTARIIFLLTYSTNLNQDELLRPLSVASTINTHLKKYAQKFEANQDESPLSGMAMMALSETLKLLFNLSAHQDNAILFQPAIKSIASILDGIQLPSPSLDPPINLLINALVNLDLSHVEILESSENSSLALTTGYKFVDKLNEVLEKSLTSYKESELEVSLPPLLTVLRKLYHIGQPDIRTRMQDLLLPIHENRDVPIGTSDTTPSRLLRLSTSALAPKLREIIPALLFELSDQDPKKFIENIGYGFAAGLLTAHNIVVPDHSKQTDGANENKGSRFPVNPVTGQRLDKEPEDEGPPMTMAEKEREAERLFVLFERLNATGVVNIQNPVRQAMTEEKLKPRIEEIDDSD